MIRFWNLSLILSLSFCIGCHHPKGQPNGGNKFVNPLFAGDYPDPSILRDGNDFYIVHSSFEYYPGLTIWHSTDLTNWLPICHALHQ